MPLLVLTIGVACLAAAISPAPAATTFDIADYATTTYPNAAKMFPRWRDSVHRYHAEEDYKGANCHAATFDRCQYKKWTFVLGNLKGRPPMETLRQVNAFMNRYRYIQDPVNWRVPDYWATPGQFFVKNGDCEDYAITKYFSLRRLGWPAEALRILYVDNLNARVDHAILAVRLDGVTYILDNIVKFVLPSNKVYHYRPIFGVNEDGGWRYMPKR